MTDGARPSGAQWSISYGAQEAVVVEVGGGLRRWRVDGDDLLDGFGEDEMCVGAAGQVLAPWPNRIRDGYYQFDGVWYQLSLSEPEKHNAIHGLVQWLPWRLVEHTGSAVTCECTVPAQPGYPWTLLLRSVYALDDTGLAVRHEATNLADSTAPFGLAVHPYLRLPDVPVHDLRLQVPARSRLLTDSRLLPIGAAKTDSTEWDFTAARRIGDMVVDTAFGSVVADEQGGSAVSLTGPDGDGVRLWADGAFRWWQVFTADTLPSPRRRRSVAVEPMTCPPDAFRSGRDVTALEPGDTWQASWHLSRMGA